MLTSAVAYNLILHNAEAMGAPRKSVTAFSVAFGNSLLVEGSLIEG